MQIKLFPHFAIGVFLVAAMETATANIIDDTYGVGAGSFELGSFSATSPGFMRLSPGSTAITGWTIGGSGGVDWKSEPLYNSDTGSRSVDLQAATGGSIFTSLPTYLTTYNNWQRIYFVFWCRSWFKWH